MTDVTLATTCPICLRQRFLKVKEEELKLFEDGHTVQSCFPDLNTDDRELVLSGICGPCWDKHASEVSMKGVEAPQEKIEKREIGLRYHRIPKQEYVRDLTS